MLVAENTGAACLAPDALVERSRRTILVVAPGAGVVDPFAMSGESSPHWW